MSKANTPERKLAERIGKKAVSDDYIEDGGYIRDWLVDDIEKAIKQACLDERERCAKIADRFYEEISGCLPKCDSYGHEELCPFTSPGPAIAAQIREQK